VTNTFKSALLRTTRIPRFVFEGGPCGGKTTALCRIFARLEDIGLTPFIVPEAATELMNGGFRPGRGYLSNDLFQELVLRRILTNEGMWRKMAARSYGLRKVMLFDRGLAGIGAYMGKEDFKFLLDRHGLNIPKARDEPYDAVFHLTTAADGAEAFYTTANNPARSETPEKARTRDALTLAAWVGHPHLHIIDNSTDFEGKLNRLFKMVCHELGIPAPLEIERKFLIERPDFSRFPEPLQKIDIEQVYLLTEDPRVERRVRRRGQGGYYVYFQTQKRSVRPGVRNEEEWQIGERAYLHALAYDYDPKSRIIRKERFCFPWKSQYFELDVFRGEHKGTHLLEIESTDEQQEIIIPPFIKIIREVTDEPAFSNRELARIK